MNWKKESQSWIENIKGKSHLLSVRIADKKNFKRVSKNNSFVISVISSGLHYHHLLVDPHRHFCNPSFVPNTPARAEKSAREMKRGEKTQRFY